MENTYLIKKYIQNIQRILKAQPSENKQVNYKMGKNSKQTKPHHKRYTDGKTNRETNTHIHTYTWKDTTSFVIEEFQLLTTNEIQLYTY